MSSATATPPALVNANFIVLSAVTIVWQIDSERPPTTVPERLPTTTESAFTSVLVTVNRPEVSSSAIAACSLFFTSNFLPCCSYSTVYYSC